MALTSAQQATLKAAILADGTLNAFPNTSDGNFDLATKLSTELASPAFIVWRRRVPLTELGDAMVGTEVAGLTTANLTRLQVYAEYNQEGINGSQNTSDAFDSIFSGAGGAGTRPLLHIVWRRSATRIEKILATGTGSDASPATMGYEGVISGTDVQAARNS